MKQGFTLIEFLIYIGIVSVLLIAAGAVAVNIFFDKAKLSAIEETNQNARLIMEKITERIRNSQSINSPIQGNSASSLSLEMLDAGKNPTIFDLSNGIVRIQEGLGLQINLTSDEVTVTNFQFTNVSYTDTPGTIRIQVTMQFNSQSGRQEYELEKNYYSTANIRKK
ncbi:MAG: type II secretion system protein [Patescibacteria group bacterium]